MKFKPGDLVLCRTLPWMYTTFDGKIGTVRADGHDDLNQHVTNWGDGSFVEWAHAVYSPHFDVVVHGCWMADHLLTKIGGPDVDVVIEREAVTS